MNIKKKYLAILSSPLLLLPTFLISCSSSSDINFDNPNIEEIIPPENSDNVVIQPPIINDNDFKVNISWKKGFQNENTFFFNGNNNYIFNLGDIIINQDGYIIQYVGSENDVYYYSLFDETIISVSCFPAWAANSLNLFNNSGVFNLFFKISFASACNLNEPKVGWLFAVYFVVIIYKSPFINVFRE